MERKTFIADMLKFGAGFALTSGFLSSCYKSDFAPILERPILLEKNTSTFLVVKNLEILKDAAFRIRFNCESVASCSLTKIIRKSKIKGDLSLKVETQGRKGKGYRVFNFVDKAERIEYSVTDFLASEKKIIIPINNDQIAISGTSIVVIDSYHELNQFCSSKVLESLS